MKFKLIYKMSKKKLIKKCMTNNKIKMIINPSQKLFSNNNRINKMMMITKQDRKKIKINNNNSNKKNRQKNR